MQLSPSASSANQYKVQPRYSGGIGVSGNQPPLFIINPVSSANSSFAWGAGEDTNHNVPSFLTGDL